MFSPRDLCSVLGSVDFEVVRAPSITGLGGLTTIHLSVIFKCLPCHLHLAQSSETCLYYYNFDMLFLTMEFICLFDEM